MKMLTIAIIAPALTAAWSCGLQTRTFNNPLDPDCKDADDISEAEAKCPKSKPTEATAGTTATQASTTSETAGATTSTSSESQPTTSTIPKLPSNPSFGDSKATVQKILGNPESTSTSGERTYWNYKALANSTYYSCELTFTKDTLEEFDSNCNASKINYGTFGDIASGAVTPTSGKTISKGISKHSIYSKWGHPDFINISGTIQWWSYKVEGLTTYSACELKIENGLLISTGSSCKTTNIDVVSF